MSFALKRNGAWWIGYADQTGKAVLQRSSCISRRHAEEAAEEMEALGRKLRLGLDVVKAAPVGEVAS